MRFRAGLIDPAITPRRLLPPDSMYISSRLLAIAGGADSLWLPDHLMSLQPESTWSTDYSGAARLVPDIHACYEPWTSLGYLAASNRLGRLRLGIGVTDTGRRHPAVTAQAAATLHHLSRGKAILGVGSGQRLNNEPYGVEWDKPVSRFEESIAIIRALWESDGHPISRDSPYFPLRDALFATPPYKGTRPEIWIASNGPRMLKLTGRYADGWLPGFSTRPLDYKQRLEVICTAASDAGRDPDTITPGISFPVLTAPTKAAVEELTESTMVKWLMLHASAELWARHGAEHPLGSDFSGIQDLLPQRLDENTMRTAVRTVPPGLVRDFCLVGTPGEVLDQLAEWRDHGARYAVFLNVSYFQRSLVKGLLTNGPLVQILRRLRAL